MRDCWARSARKARSRETMANTVDTTTVVTVAITTTWRHSSVGYLGGADDQDAARGAPGPYRRGRSAGGVGARRAKARRSARDRRPPDPELEPPWASRMMAMTAMYPMGMMSQAHSGRRSQGSRKAAATRAKKMTPAMEISRRASWGKGMTAMRIVPTTTRAKTGQTDPHGAREPEGQGGPGQLWIAAPAPRRVEVLADSLTGSANGSGSRSLGRSRSGLRRPRPSRACGGGAALRT